MDLLELGELELSVCEGEVHPRCLHVTSHGLSLTHTVHDVEQVVQVIHSEETCLVLVEGEEANYSFHSNECVSKEFKQMLPMDSYYNNAL